MIRRTVLEPVPDHNRARRPEPCRTSTGGLLGAAWLRLSVLWAGVVMASLWCVWEARGQQAFGRQWGRTYSTQDWNRFYHYPYVYYPQNFWGADYYRSSEDMYYRYPPEMRIPVYNRQWHNYCPQERRYHQGHHFIMDVF